MANRIHILHLEDDPLDTELVLDRLQRAGGLPVEIDRVDDLRAFRDGLDRDDYALILSDYSLPGIDPRETLQLARTRRPELPFIFLSGTIAEDTAIEMLKLGASDYVLKQRPGRLAAAIRRSLREAEEQALRRQAEQDLRAAKEAAEQANRAKTEFLANISHELRTPMTVIMGHTELLLASSTDAQKESLRALDSSARRLLGIIDDLLDISRIETHSLKIEERPFDQRECVRQAVELFAAPAQEKGLQLDWEIDPALPPMALGDPDRIGQILVNLVGNAVKFTERGTVTVRVAADNHGPLYTIRDTGIGIPVEKMASLFRPFTQVDSSLTRRFGGAGLGLAISRELVEMMGGRIWAQSVDGEGSTFSFTLPLRPVEAEAAMGPEEAGEEERMPQILLAEDDPMVRSLIEILLRRCNWGVTPAENGQDAVDRWREGGIDLILMDMQMPVLDGLEATREIRGHEEAWQGGHTPIVALTAHARQEDRQKCLEAGMDGYLSKPIRLTELQTIVADCLAGNCRPQGAGDRSDYRRASPNI